MVQESNRGCIFRQTLGRNYSHAFDNVAHITRWVPEWLERLRLPDAVDGANLQRMCALRQLRFGAPGAEGILAEILAQVGEPARALADVQPPPGQRRGALEVCRKGLMGPIVAPI